MARILGSGLIRGAAAALPWWNIDSTTPAGVCVFAYQPRGAASLAASYANLTGLADGVPSVAPAWDTVLGWKYNNSLNQYVDTGWVPPSQAVTLIIQFSAFADIGPVCGVWTAGQSTVIIAPNAGGANVNYVNGANMGVAPPLLTGNLAISGNQGYRNGVADGAAFGAWGVAQTGTIKIGYVPGYGRCIGNIQAVAGYVGALAATPLAARATAMAAL